MTYTTRPLARDRGRERGLTTTSLILCALAAFFFLLMVTVLGGWWPVRLVGGGLLVVAGLAILAWGLLRHRLLPQAALE